MGRSRGGLTTKIHALVDANGLPIALKLTGVERRQTGLWHVTHAPATPSDCKCAIVGGFGIIRNCHTMV